MKQFEHDGEMLTLAFNTYVSGGGTRIDILDDRGAPFAVLSKNVPGLEEGEFALKNFDENAVFWASCRHLFEDTGKRIPSGYYTLEVWRLL